MTKAASVHLKLGGAMVKFAPQGQPGSSHTIELASQSTIQSILDELQVPLSQPLMIILNDAMVARTEYDSTSLTDGDKLALMPPIQAG